MPRVFVLFLKPKQTLWDRWLVYNSMKYTISSILLPKNLILYAFKVGVEAKAEFSSVDLYL